MNAIILPMLTRGFFLLFIIGFSTSQTTVAQQVLVHGTISKRPVVKERIKKGPYGRKSTTDKEVDSAENSVILIWVEQQGFTFSQENSEKIQELKQFDIQFEPRLIAITEGQPVSITNNDPIYHNVFSLSSVKKFDIGKRFTGESVTVYFDKPGLVQVFCDIHSHMNADIMVLPKNTVTKRILSNETDFQLKLPDYGVYTIKAYSKGFNQFEKEVTISKASNPIIEVEFSN